MSKKKTKVVKQKAEEATEREATLYAEKQDLYIRKVLKNSIKKFDERAELSGLSRADYFRELMDRSYQLFLEIKYAEDQRRKSIMDEMAANEEPKKKGRNKA